MDPNRGPPGKKSARTLLKEALEVGDDQLPLTDGQFSLTSDVLKKVLTLISDNPFTSPDGILLRRVFINTGLINIMLSRLAVLTHQSETESSKGIRTKTSEKTNDSAVFWPKGVGYGSGSRNQTWNYHEVIAKSQEEDEQIRLILLIFAQYLGYGSCRVLDPPPQFVKIITESCLISCVISFLRNDSILDIIKRIPMFEAIFKFLQCMTYSNKMACLLLIGKDTDNYVASLISKMTACIEDYINSINRSKMRKTTGSAVSEEIELDEGLINLLKLIKKSSDIVSKATEVFCISEFAPIGTAKSCAPVPVAPPKSLKEIYVDEMKKLLFATYDIVSENSDDKNLTYNVAYYYHNDVKAAGEKSHPSRIKRLAQESATLSTSLPVTYSSTIFVRCDTNRYDIMKVLIVGPEDTPYSNGCFEFDVYFPPDYPNNPMKINLQTTGRKSVRFNPNLYDSGKVCLSVLNTWDGKPEEKWNVTTSNLLQVLISIQSLILVPDPYFNEPGYESTRNKPMGISQSMKYNDNIMVKNIEWAMVDQIRSPSPCFKEVIHKHFWLKRNEIIQQIEGWISDSSKGGLFSTAKLMKAQLKNLRIELEKLNTPEGLEQFAGPLVSEATWLFETEMMVIDD